MDYPHPLVTLNQDGVFDLSDAYDVGIGAWDDKVAITYGYQDFAESVDAPAALDAALADAWARDIRYMTGQGHRRQPPRPHLGQRNRPGDRAASDDGCAWARHSRGSGRVPSGTVRHWRCSKRRSCRSSSTTGSRSTPPRRPRAGLDYIYAMRGDGRDPLSVIPAADQRAALMALMRTLQAAELTIPTSVIDLIPPRPAGFGRHRELFPRYTGAMFDRVTPAVVVADMTVSTILQPARSARLVEQHALDRAVPGLVEVIETMLETTFFDVVSSDPYEAEVQRAVQRVVVNRLNPAGLGRADGAGACGLGILAGGSGSAA